MYGAADLRKHDVPSSGGYETVLLLPSRAEYLRRYDECCQMRPEERAHDASGLYRTFTRSRHIFDRVIRADLSAEQTVNAVLAPYDTTPQAVSGMGVDPTAGSMRGGDGDGGVDGAGAPRDTVPGFGSGSGSGDGYMGAPTAPPVPDPADPVAAKMAAFEQDGSSPAKALFG